MWLSIEAANKIKAELSALAPRADIRWERHPIENKARVRLSISDSSTGNSAVRFAEADSDAAALLEDARAELQRSARKTRSAIRAEKRAT